VDGFNKALEIGYSLVDVFEFWEYSVTRFEKGEGGLFADYINMFRKLK
jgi:hypothetical protein